MKALRSEIPFEVIRRQSESLYDKIQELDRLMEEGESYHQEIPVTSVCYLLAYMKSCFQSLQKLPTEEEKKTLRKCLKTALPRRWTMKNFWKQLTRIAGKF